MKHLSYIASGILIFLLIRQCNNNAVTVSVANANIAALTDSVTTYRNLLGTQTSAIKTLQLNNRQFRQIIISKDAELQKLTEDFARVRSLSKITATLLYDTIHLHYKDSVPIRFSRKGRLTSDWYSLKYASDQNGILIDSLQTWTSTTVITGVKRKWFFGKPVLTTEVTNTNPYINVTGIKSAEITLSEPFYRKWYIWLAAGLAGGYILGR